MIPLIIIGLIVIFVLQMGIIYIVIRKLIKDKKEGYPRHDERTKMISYKSGHYSFWLTWPLWLGIFVVSSFTGGFQPDWVIYFGLISMMVFYITTNIYFKKKGL